MIARIIALSLLVLSPHSLRAQAWEFDGIEGLGQFNTSYIDCGESTELYSLSAYTMIVWARSYNLGLKQRLYSRTQSGGLGLGLNDYYTVNNLAEAWGHDTAYRKANYNMTTAGMGNYQWFTMAATWDGSNVRLYIDGTLRATTAMTGTQSRGHWHFLLAAEPDGITIDPTDVRRVLYGTMTRFVLYNTALSANAIQSMHYTGQPVPSSALRVWFEPRVNIPVGSTFSSGEAVPDRMQRVNDAILRSNTIEMQGRPQGHVQQLAY